MPSEKEIDLSGEPAATDPSFADNTACSADRVIGNSPSVGNRNAGNSAAEHEGVPATSLGDIRVLALDPRGYRITSVYWKTKDYAIFEARGRVSPMFSDDDRLSETQRQRYMQIGPSLARINTLEPSRLIRRLGLFNSRRTQDARFEIVETSSSNYFSREIARAIALSLDGMGEKARALLKALEQKLVNVKQNEHRMIYLVACFMLMAVFVAVVIITTYAASDLPFVHGNIVLLRATALGVVAGFFSVALGIRSLHFDLDARWHLTLSYGLTRLLIAGIASIFTYFAIQSGIVFADLGFDPVTSTRQDRSMIYTLAFLSGFSEQFVPNVLKNLGDARSGDGTDAHNGAVDTSREQDQEASRAGRQKVQDD